jgi:hypothetical protein
MVMATPLADETVAFEPIVADLFDATAIVGLVIVRLLDALRVYPLLLNTSEPAVIAPPIVMA